MGKHVYTLEQDYSTDSCPVCTKDKVEVGTISDSWQELSCSDCGAFWMEEYELKRVQVWTDGDKAGMSFPDFTISSRRPGADQGELPVISLRWLRLGLPLGLLLWGLIWWAVSTVGK